MKWQKCPICDGVGQVSGGYFNRAGDCDSWTAANVMESCRVCQGRGIILESNWGEKTELNSPNDPSKEG